MDDGRQNEAGFALIYALAAIILSSLMIGLVFLVARNVNSQIRTVDSFRRVEDVHEYSFQLASQDLKLRIDDLITRTMRSGGFYSYNNEWIDHLEPELVSIFDQVDVNETIDNTFAFTSSVVDYQFNEIAPYVMTKSGGEQGWIQAASMLPDKTNLQIIIQIQSQVTDQTQLDEGQPRVHTASAEYIYEMQLEEEDLEQNQTQLDIWRNIFYPYYLPSTAGQAVSADTWVRKLFEVADFQRVRPAFDYLAFESDDFLQFGFANNVLQDFQDGRFLDFRTKPILNWLHFDGSFFFNHGIQMEGQGSGQFSAKSLLAIQNDGGQPSNGLNLIKDIFLQAGLGMYIDLGSRAGSRLVLSQAYTDILAGNLWINNTNSSASRVEQEGVLFAEGHLNVSVNSPDAGSGLGELNSNYFNFYHREATKQNPAADGSLTFMKPSMVLTSSNFYAGPVTEGSIVHSTEDTERRITVYGDFMLTNTMMPSGGTIDDFSYFQNQNQFTVPHDPSRITLDGSNTMMEVHGLSFIDAPKTARRLALAEAGSSAVFDSYYEDPAYWNQITLKNGAQLILGHTGVEPFHLAVDRESTFVMEILPDLALFDPTFLATGAHNRRLEGTVVLVPYYMDDQVELENQLQQLGVNYRVRDFESQAQPGEVTILRSFLDRNMWSDDEAYLTVTRMFDYINKLDC